MSIVAARTLQWVTLRGPVATGPEVSIMDGARASVTALVTAYARAYHAEHDHPRVFDDRLAWQLLSPQERDFLGAGVASTLSIFDPELAGTEPDSGRALAAAMRYNAPTTISRSAYTEECLAAAVDRGTKQYVLIGAGLDTFAHRRVDLADRVTVFELDHPATQQAKRERLAGLDWPHPANLHYVPIDLTTGRLAAALGGSAYDRSVPAFFGWLGVTYYLPVEAVWATIRAVAEVAAQGSTLVFDYFDPAAFDDRTASVGLRGSREITRRAGEPLRTWLDPGTLADQLDETGFELVENVEPAAVQRRYFAGRTDGYQASEHAHFARALRR